MVFTLTAILIASIGVTPAFAQMQDPIVISTDKPSYSDGETVIVSGQVRELLSGFPITLQVIAPNGNKVGFAQLDVGADKMYSTEITAGGPLWKAAGTYTIMVLYGTEARTAETTFEFGGSTGGPGGGPGGPTIDVEGYLVGYSITGGSIVSITADVDANSLIIEISTTSDGELTVTLPRALIDAVLENGDDDDFFVLVDGEEVDFDETKSSSDRTLTIAFPDGAEEIEIIGTFVIPEFGAIAALILAVAIISIIVVSAKTRLSLIPRY
jgi:predicted secreted protein with PEFG-CTERM motif